MAKWTAPDTYEDFVTEYTYFIDSMIREISRWKVSDEDLLELRQAVLLRIFQWDYLKKYDPKKGSFSNYVYFLVRSVVVNEFDKSTRNPLNRAIGVTETFANERERRRLVLEAHRELVDHQFEREQATRDLFEKLERSCHHERRAPELIGTLHLLYAGYTPDEIGKKLAITTGKVRARRRKLQSLLAYLMAEPA